MNPIIERVKHLITTGAYDKALDAIDKALPNPLELGEAEKEDLYAKLLGLRISANSLDGNPDNVVLDFVRKEKFPAKETYLVSNKHEVTTMAKNLFLFECDAMVNTIHVDKFFSFAERSASQDFLDRIGDGTLNEMIDKSKKYALGDFIRLEHKSLLAPMSYHIFCYDGDLRVDIDALSEGLKKVLADATTRKLGKIGFFPLGYGVLGGMKEPQKTQLAQTIADKVAESVVSFIWENETKKIPHIYFNFVHPKSQTGYDRVLYRWTSMDKGDYRSHQQLQQRHRELVDECCTSDEKYVEMLEKVSRVCDEPSRVLILGETGVGKSYLAGLIHKKGSRSGRPFKSENCARLRHDQMYQTLFGWKKGSFTGATEDGVGLIAASEKGTLFLDEIGYAEIKVQQSLLTFIEKGTYNRFGDPEERQSDVRLMFGTNQDLQRMIQDKEFAHDFYERISEREFVIPSLRERIGDIELLVKKVISGLNHSTLCDIEVAAEAIEELKQYKWPGNLRQLINYVKGLHDDCRYQRTVSVSIDMIKQSPPRDGSYTQRVVLENFQETIRSLIRNWEPSMGKILDDVIAPIVAKSYLDDLKMSRTDASKITGLDGTRGEESTILHKLLQYESARKKFS